MDLWYPPKDRPHLLDWWRPLILASRAARLERCPWPIHVDELVLRGRVSRKGRPDIWVYSHPGSGGELYVDHTGQTYSFTRTPRGKSYGRFQPCEIRTAVWRARLPDVVAPVAAGDDLPVAGGPAAAASGASMEAGPAAGAAARHPAGGREHGRQGPRRRGHLTVYEGGRSLAG